MPPKLDRRWLDLPVEFVAEAPLRPAIWAVTLRRPGFEDELVLVEAPLPSAAQFLVYRDSQRRTPCP